MHGEKRRRRRPLVTKGVLSVKECRSPSVQEDQKEDSLTRGKHLLAIEGKRDIREALRIHEKNLLVLVRKGESL